MRTLILADIHGNHSALRAVLAEPHDRLICLGDVVGYGPDPAACLDDIRTERGVVIQGNHDHALANRVSPRCSAAFKWLAEATTHIAESQLGWDAINYLSALPKWAKASVDQLSYLAVHATPVDPLYQYLGPNSDEWGREVDTIDANLLLVGHTHLQFELRVGTTRVVNPGSVGQPKDGDPRAAYAVIVEGELQLKRADYDVEHTIRSLRASHTGDGAVDVLVQLLRTGRVPAV